MKNLSTKIVNGYTLLAMTSILILSAFAYGETIQYFFVGSDSIALIESSRVESIDDFVRVFSSPLMNGTDFVNAVGLFYRPVSSLTYSMDYAIWGMEPIGYHLTNLSLHILTSLVVYLVVLQITNGRKLTSMLAAILFSIHPIGIYPIPAIDRRQDILVTLLSLTSLLFYLKYSKGSSGLRILIISLAFYILALLSKEIALILPLILFAYLIIMPASDADIFAKQRFVTSIVKVTPFLLIGFIVSGIRAFVLRGMGGYFEGTNEAFPDFESSMSHVVDYIDFLFNPLHFEVLNKFTSLFSAGLTLAILVSVPIVIWFVAQSFLRSHNIKSSHFLNRLALTLFSLFAAGVVSLLLYPIVAPYVVQLMADGYGPEFIDQVFAGSQNTPLNDYIRKADILLQIPVLVMTLFIMYLLVVLEIWKVDTSNSNRAILFSLTWLILPLMVFIILGFEEMKHRYVYFALLPLCLILALIISDATEDILSVFQRNERKFEMKSTLIFPSAKLLLATAVITLLLAASPLFRQYSQWDLQGRSTAVFLDELSKIVPQVPDDSVIKLVGFPRNQSVDAPGKAQVETASGLAQYSIESWTKLRYPDKNIDIEFVCRNNFDRDQCRPIYNEAPLEFALFIDNVKGKEVFVKFIFFKPLKVGDT